MKKHYLFLAFCCMASSLLAQSLSPFDLYRILAQKHEQLTPDMVRSEISQFDDQLMQKPPALEISYNLRDSTYKDQWDSFSDEWVTVKKTFYENDCAIGKPVVVLDQMVNSLSGNFVNCRKRLYQYFDDGNEQQVETYLWHPIQETWEQSSFHSDVRPAEPTEYWDKHWDASTNSFTSGSRAVFTYNSDDKVSLYEGYRWVADTWELSSRISFTYINGLNTVGLGEYYDEATATWTPSGRSTITYNANGDVLTQKYESNLGNGYVDQRMTINTYNNSNQLTEKVVQYNNGSGLENSGKTIYAYYNNGNLQGNDGFIWLSNAQDWLMNSQMTFREDGQVSYSLFKGLFHESTGQFDFGFQSSFFFTADGLLDYSLAEEFDLPNPNVWFPNQKTTNTYDGNNRLLEEILQDWDEDEMAFTNNSRFYHFNTGCLFSDVDETQPEAPANCLHANPLRPGQAIQCPTLPQTDEPLTLSLYSMAGQRLHQQAFWPDGKFQPSQPLAPGIYLLDIRSEKGSSVHRAKVVVVE